MAVAVMGASSKFWMREFDKDKEGISVLSFQPGGHIKDLNYVFGSLKMTNWFSFRSHSGFGRERGRGGERYGGGGGGGYGGGFDNRSGGVSKFYLVIVTFQRHVFQVIEVER